MGLSALLVSTDWAMREPLGRGTSSMTGSTFFCLYAYHIFINRQEGAVGKTHLSMRKFFTFRFTLIALFAAMSMVVNAEVIKYKDGYLDYKLDTDAKTAQVVQFTGFIDSIAIPAVVIYDDIAYSVTSLRDRCFSYASTLTSIIIPSSVTTIGDECFYGCRALKTINIPSSVTSLGKCCFSDCSSLVSINVDANNKVYDSRENCNAIIETESNTMIIGCKTTVIPSSVTSLGTHCFNECSTLTSITIPSSVTSIGDKCFYGCSSLTSITVDENNEVYDSRENCNAIIKTSTNEMIQGCKMTVIPSSVTRLGNYCFAECSSLMSIDIPSSVTSIGGFCFYKCSSLTSITIPSSVKSLGTYCFGDCTSLKTVTCEMPTAIDGSFFSFTPIDQATLYVPKASLDSYKATSPWSGFGTILPIESLNITVDTDTKEAVVETAKFVEDGEVVIPASVEVEGVTYTVTSIASEAFKGVDDVETVTLPRTLKEIGDGAFTGCKALKEVVVSEAATSSKVSAVRYGKIQRVAIRAAGDGMRIGERAFADCPVLAAVTIPATATTIGDNVFNNCESLKNVNCEAVNCPAVNTFGEFPISEATLTVPVGSLSQYSTTNPWSLFGKIQDSDGTTDISSVSAHDGNDVKAVYGIDGSKRTVPAKGLNIIRMNDGTTMKVMR